MPLVTLREVSLTFGGPPVLDHVELRLEPGEKVCLIGRNGSGKTSLLRAIAGKLEVDGGEVERAPGLRIGLLPQEVPEDLAGPVYDVVAGGIGTAGDLLAAFHDASARLAAGADAARLARLESLQRALDTEGGWSLHREVERTIQRLDLDPEADAASLSAGLKRRVLLARALVRNPDLLLLDEPTNHLDIEAIAWLEQFLAGFPGALLFVTHDRVFLEALATRILDLDRGRLTSWPGSYEVYREKKAAWLDEEAQHAAAFDRKLAEEEVWIRQGVKERRTRNEGRVRRLLEMRRERRARRERLGKVQLVAEEAERSGRLVIKAEGISFAWRDRPIARDFSTAVMRGDRIGIVGPNGSGKTTLLRLLLGELEPDAGTVRHGTRLEIAYFDQLHAQLDESRSVADNVADGRSTITRGGGRLHVLGYLKQFLFTPERARGAVTSLSGGERNRLLLARLFARPSNVLVLDEPTNDLDLETLELLEELLLDYPGTVLLVSHDRALLNRVVTASFVLEGNGRVREYSGGYDDWIRERAPAEAERPRAAPPAAPLQPAAPRPRRLSYREKQELAALPERIEALEAKIAALHGRLADPALYRRPAAEIAGAHAELQALETEHAAAYRRWEELEALA
ncbi:MAG: ATP-binding cassette domain-containing protein [Planctomycetes bacterium]|nr:ATP-binding cassette domain-containing protein [Planctomycetota bacterium]